MSKDRSRENSASNHSASDREAQGVTRDSDATATRNDQASGMEDKVVLTDMASRLKSLEHKLATQPEIDQNHITSIESERPSVAANIMSTRVGSQTKCWVLKRISDHQCE